MCIRDNIQGIMSYSLRRLLSWRQSRHVKLSRIFDLYPLFLRLCCKNNTALLRKSRQLCNLNELVQIILPTQQFHSHPAFTYDSKSCLSCELLVKFWFFSLTELLKITRYNNKFVQLFLEWRTVSWNLTLTYGPESVNEILPLHVYTSHAFK